MISFVNYQFNTFPLLKCGVIDGLFGGSSSGSSSSSSGAEMVAGAVLGSAIAGEATKDAANTAADANIKATESTNQTNMQNWREQREYDYNKWKEMLEYNTPANQVKRYQDAGINPALAMSNIESGTISSSAGGQTVPTMEAPQQDVGTMAMANSAPLRGLIDGLTSGSNALLTLQQAKAQNLQNMKSLATMVDEVNSLHFDTNFKKMTNQLFDATLEDQIQMTKQSRLQSYIKTSIDSLTQVGSEYDIGMKRFDFLNLKPLELQGLQQGLAKTCAEISLTWAQRKLTLQQVDSLINDAALGWSRLSLDWFNARNNNRHMLNQEWNTTQSTYRDNFMFNKSKNLFVKQIELGTKQLNHELWRTNVMDSKPGRFLGAFGMFGQNTVGAWSPFVGALGK